MSSPDPGVEERAGPADLFARHSLGELRDLAEMTAVVAAAASTGVFRAMADEPRGPERLARRLGLDERAVRILLPALADLGLLEERGGLYHLTEHARRSLADPEAETYAARGLPHWLHGLRAWSRLPQVLRLGGPLEDEEPAGERDRSRLDRFMEAMAAAPTERVERLVRACLRRVPGARTMLDLGGGPGHIARAFAGAGLEATLLDTPETVGHVEGAYGLGEVEGLRVVGADFLEDPLPDGPFDVVLLSNVTHIYSPEDNRRLLGKAAAVTAPDGIVAIVDFVRGRSGRAARFALLMLMKTDGGSTYTEADYRSWLEESGFGEMEIEDLDPDRQIITARR